MILVLSVEVFKRHWIDDPAHVRAEQERAGQVDSELSAEPEYPQVD